MSEEEDYVFTDDDIYSKVITVDEFVQLGLLQEINRLFLHPMGFSLAVNINDESGIAESFGTIWDFRDHPEVAHFTDEVILSARAKERANKIGEMSVENKDKREAKLGYFVQPLHYVRPPKDTK